CERSLGGQHGYAEPEERCVAVLHGPPPRRRPVPEDASLYALVEALELGVRGGAPARGAGTCGLVDLQVGDRVLAQPVPIAIHAPGLPDHRAGLVPGPEAAHQASAQLVTMLLEHARQLHDAGIAGGIVGGLRAGPGVLVTADNHEIVRPALHLADGDLNGAP